MSSSSSPSAEDTFAFQQLPPAPPQPPRRVDVAVARREAEQLISAAQSEADAIREQARADGYAEGHTAGRSEAVAQAAPAVQALAEALVQAQAERERVAHD